MRKSEDLHASATCLVLLASYYSTVRGFKFCRYAGIVYRPVASGFVDTSLLLTSLAFLALLSCGVSGP